MAMASPNPSWFIVSSYGSADTGRVQHSPRLGPDVIVVLSIRSFGGVLMGQETIVIHLHIAKVRVRTFTVSTKDRIDRRLLATMSTLYGVRPQQQQIGKFRSDSMTPTPH